MSAVDACGEGSSTEQLIELRSRSNRAYRDDIGRSPSEKVIVEKKVKPGDSLNKIALQYSVPVAELKRVNNIVADQDLFALPVVKIPISRLRKELNLEHERELLKNDSPVTESEPEDDSEERRLLSGSGGRMYRSVEELFEQADASVSQVRDNLPTPLVDGAFHFVDASSPDNTHKGMWFLVAVVVTLFVLIPLLLTFFEEYKEVPDKDTVLQTSRHSAP